MQARTRCEPGTRYGKGENRGAVWARDVGLLQDFVGAEPKGAVRASHSPFIPNPPSRSSSNTGNKRGTRAPPSPLLIADLQPPQPSKSSSQMHLLRRPTPSPSRGTQVEPLRTEYTGCVSRPFPASLSLRTDLLAWWIAGGRRSRPGHERY
jgi:hypothetical protein